MSHARHRAPRENRRPAITSGCTSPARARAHRRSSCGVTGCRIGDAEGRTYLDGLAGLFTVQVGHGRRELAEAAARQAAELAYFPLWSYAHPPAIELAERIAHYAPGDLNRVFFTSGGGEAVEAAWKLAKQYFKLVGKPLKTKVISRSIAYHGTTQGALAITGVTDYREPFEPLVPGASKVPNTNAYRAPARPAPTKAFGLWAADRVEEAILAEGADTVAAVFVEPVQNAGGCFPPPPGYFERVREICDSYDVLLVSDEVICAFGRIGSMFACDDFGYVPDIITCAKGMTSGYVAARGDDRQRPAVRAVRQRHRVVPARLHVRRAPGVGGGGAGQPGHLRARGDQRARARAVARVPRHPGEAPRPADRRRRARRGLLLRHRAGEGQGHEGDVRRRGERAAAARLPLEGAVRGGAVLPHRRPRRPRDPARAAADRRTGRVRGDGADPARGADRGLDRL